MFVYYFWHTDIEKKSKLEFLILTSDNQHIKQLFGNSLKKLLEIVFLLIFNANCRWMGVNLVHFQKY